MNNIEAGGPAFPSEPGPLENDHMIQTGDYQWHHPGMTLRDYFAAKALQGMLANNEISGPYTDYARRSFVAADAMIEARK